jgi:type I restriction enzyme R subunit
MSDTIPEVDPTCDDPTEFTVSEQPMLKQLGAMGWAFVKGDLDYPAKTFRSSFSETLLLERLRAAFRRLNLDSGGNEWLDDLTIDRAIRELTRRDGRGLVEINRVFMERLASGVRVAVAEGPRCGEEVTLWPIAWEPERLKENEFVAINQFSVLIPGTPYSKRPDIVLFVNGLPLVVIECKSPAISEPLQSALDDLLHYSAQKRRDAGEREGISDLFHFNALMVGTSFYHARAGVVGASEEHFAEWKDVGPADEGQVREELQKPKGDLSPQEVLTAGMLRPSHLLDLVRNFTVWETTEGKLIKKVARYQQFRATHAAIQRLLTGRSRLETGDADERGGVIWHTQGSGKSLTMVFLVKKIRMIPALRDFKIVIVTDRTQLERQMRETARLAGENIRPNEEEKKRLTSLMALTKRVLREPGPDVVFCMMQKNQQIDLGEREALEYDVPAYVRVEPEKASKGPLQNQEQPVWKPLDQQQQQQGPVSDHGPDDGTQIVNRKLRQTLPSAEPVEPLNESPRILLLIDECHRTQAGDFHSYMMASLPNAAKIGFTGTPIFREGDKNTLGIFGRFLDKYGMTASFEDKATVEIFYEGRSADGLVEETQKLDQAFDNRFRHYTDKEKAAIRQRYGNEPDILEAPKLIEAKARDMMLHYAGEILPNGFKAQIVAVTRLGAVRYQKALEAARDQLVSEIEAIPAEVLALSPDQLAEESIWMQYLCRVHPHLDRLRSLEITACISGGKDPTDWKRWTDPENRESHERRFKMPFEHEDPAKSSPLGMIVVKNMLLTGFDAPVEQVLYLDRKMADHELLQAITRVNRTRAGKACGYVVDYAGVGDALAAALKAIRELEEGEGKGGSGGVTSLPQALPRLREAHQRVLQVFTNRGISSLLPIDPPIQLLADAAIRAEFINKLRVFLNCLGVIFTRPEALEFKRDAKILAFIARVAANVYQDPQLLLLGVEKKVKELVDAYIAAEGIDPKVPLLSILDANFAEEIKKLGSSKTKASAMAHAIRIQLTIKTEEDPALFKTLSEKLEAILKEMEGRWDEMIRAFESLLKDVERADSAYSVEGLDPKIHGPFFGLLREALNEGAEVEPDQTTELVDLTRRIVDQIRTQIRTVDFWQDGTSRKQLENWIYKELRRSGMISRPKCEPLALSLVALAERRKRILVS